MKILLLNQDWFANELREAGHEVVSTGLASHLDHVVPTPLLHIDSVIASLPNQFTPDVIIWLDNSAPLMFLGLEECDCPIVFYSVDTHHHVVLHSRLSEIFDYTLVAQKDYIAQFPVGAAPVTWFPLWAPRFVEQSSKKEFGATFVGNVSSKLNPERVRFFEALQKIHPVHITQGEYWKIFPHAEIVVNQTVKRDLNFRVFEAMMCGALLLTERSDNGLTEIFAENKHLVFYEKGNEHEAAEKIRALLGDLTRTRSIATSGRDEILAKHTARHRAEQLLDIISTAKKRKPSATRYLATMLNFSAVSTLLQNMKSGMEIKSLIAALTAAERALNAGEIPNETDTAHAVVTALKADRITRTSSGQNLMDRFADAYPENPLFSLARIRNRLNIGAHDEAEKYAKVFSSEPSSVVFQRAEEAITSIVEVIDTPVPLV